MGLTTALQIGRSGLLSSQQALQTAGNNLANVNTPGYHRQRVDLSATATQRVQPDARIGTGVGVDAIGRQVSQAVEARLRSAIGDENHSQTRQQLLGQIESIQNELSDTSLSNRLDQFFNNWSELANKPQDESLRNVVVNEAQTLTRFVQNMRSEMTKLRTQVTEATQSSVTRINELLSRVETLNDRISSREASGGEAMALRDDRGQALEELGQYLDVSTQQHKNGEVDVFVGSKPIMLNGQSRGVTLTERQIDGQSVTKLVTEQGKTALDLSSGKLAAQLKFKRNDLDDAINTLDTFAKQLIYQVNRKHTQGQGLTGIDQVTSDNAVADTTAALNSAEADLAHQVEHGSFKLHVTQKSTGQRQTHVIDVDLDGINPGSDTTLQSLASAINGKANVSASITASGQLQIQSGGDDFSLSFSDDSSGALAALGVNSFLTGKDATDIGVNSAVAQNVNRVAAASDHQRGDNGTALAIAGLRDEAVGALNNSSLTEYWRQHVERVGIEVSEAKEQAQADQTVRENLKEQQQSVSGVNVDEQTLDLMQYQRAFQASARFVSTVDQLMQTLIQSI
jgi:flagellar hook-associated protein 1 FlgK